jgi:hypothetical protein
MFFVASFLSDYFRVLDKVVLMALSVISTIFCYFSVFILLDISPIVLVFFAAQEVRISFLPTVSCRCLLLLFCDFADLYNCCVICN